MVTRVRAMDAYGNLDASEAQVHEAARMAERARRAVLLLGLLRREKSGAGNIGFESVLVLAIYAGAILFQIALG